MKRKGRGGFRRLGRFGRNWGFQQNEALIVATSRPLAGFFREFRFFRNCTQPKGRAGCLCLGQGVLIDTPALPTRPGGVFSALNDRKFPPLLSFRFLSRFG